jgi:hypothetical protein
MGRGRFRRASRVPPRRWQAAGCPPVWPSASAKRQGSPTHARTRVRFAVMSLDFYADLFDALAELLGRSNAKVWFRPRRRSPALRSVIGRRSTSAHVGGAVGIEPTTRGLPLCGAMRHFPPGYFSV